MSTFKMEWIKLTKRKSTKVLAIIFGLLLIGLSVVYIYGESISGLSIYNEGQFVLSSLSVMMGFFLPFVTLYLAAVAFGQDFEQGTIKNMFLTPIKRETLFLNKFLAVLAVVSSLILVNLLVSLLLSLVIDGGFAIIGVIISEYVGAIFSLGLLTLVGALISLLIGSTGMTIFIAYIGSVVIGFLGLYFPVIKNISLTRAINGYDALFHSTGLTLLLSGLAYYIIVYIVGYLVFEKKEDKSCQFE